jgi:hypothetical protein
MLAYRQNDLRRLQTGSANSTIPVVVTGGGGPTRSLALVSLNLTRRAGLTEILARAWLRRTLEASRTASGPWVGGVMPSGTIRTRSSAPACLRRTLRAGRATKVVVTVVIRPSCAAGTGPVNGGATL